MERHKGECSNERRGDGPIEAHGSAAIRLCVTLRSAKEIRGTVQSERREMNGDKKNGERGRGGVARGSEKLRGG